MPPKEKPALLAKDLIPRIGKQDLPPVLLICPGTAGFNKEPWEPVLAERAVEAIIAHYVDPSLRDSAYTAYYADEVDASQIVMECQTLPFLAERRVVVVRNAERYLLMSGEKGSPLEHLLDYFKSPADFTLLVFVAAKSDKRKKFYTACKAAGDVVECPQLGDDELGAWVREEAQRQGKGIGVDAVTEIIARSGGRLSDLSNAMSLVANYVGAAPTIRADDVIAACADVAEETVWNLTDAIAASNSARALHTLHQLLDLGKSVDEILGIVNWLLETAYQASPETPQQLRSKYNERKVLPLAQKWGLQKLKDALVLCTKTHFQTRESRADKELLVELLITKLAYPTPAKRAAARR